MIEHFEKEEEFHNILIPAFFNNEIIQQFYQVYQLPKQNIKGLQIYCEMIKSENTLEMYEGLEGLRTILSGQSKKFELEATSLAVCEFNTLKYINNIIEHNKFQLILYEALWILNILIFDQSQIDQIIENGAINCLIQKFASRNYHDLIINFICLIFSNVTAYSIKNQNLTIKLGALKILNNYVRGRENQFENLDLIGWLARSIRYCFYFSSELPSQDLQVSIRIFSKWIQQDIPIHILSYICDSFSEFVHSHPPNIQVIIDLGIMARIIELVEVDVTILFTSNIFLLTKILESHQNHQEYLYGLGIIPCLGRLFKKYSEFPEYLQQILKAFRVISQSNYLSQFLLNSNELNQLFQLFKIYNAAISDLIHLIIENLIESNKDIGSINLIERKILMIWNISAARNYIRIKKELWKKILNICDTYSKDERYTILYQELEELKNWISHKFI